MAKLAAKDPTKSYCYEAGQWRYGLLPADPEVGPSLSGGRTLVDPDQTGGHIKTDRETRQSCKPQPRLIAWWPRWDEAIAEMDPFRSSNAIQLLAALNGIEPTIWRRLVVPCTWHLGQLHLTIQAAFGWCDYHLHEFRIGGVAYGDPENNEWNDDKSIRTFDETELRLFDFAREPGRSFDYVYDFGDCWRHTLTVEEVLGSDIAPRVATLIDGARARPPEDVGGTGGYEDFLAIMADPHDLEHRSTKRWCGGHFDPAWFDLAIADKDVRNALKPEVRRRLHQPKPKRTTRPKS